jgi:hypothetical protein
MDKPSALNPNGWAIMAHVALGGVVPARLPGETNDFCRIKMTEGNDDQITLNIEDLKGKSVLKTPLSRDQHAEVLVNGNGYRVSYPSVEVAADQPDTSPFAVVIVSRATAAPSAAANVKAAPGLSSRTFTLRHKPAWQVKENLRYVLQGHPDAIVAASADNGQLTVTATPDVLNRVATFIVVEDWPNAAKDSPQIELAKKFFRLCAQEDGERVGKMLSIYVLLDLMGKSIERYPPVTAADVEAVRLAKTDWPGKDAAIRAVITAYTKYPLSRIRYDDPGRFTSHAIVAMPLVEFENAPQEFGRMSFGDDGNGGLAINCVPPWFSRAEARKLAPQSQYAELEFRLVAAEGDTRTPADELADPGDRTGQQKLRVLKEVLLDSSAVESASLTTSKAQSDHQPHVQELSIVLKKDAAKKFANITAANIGRRLAIVWRGRVLSTPVIRDRISGPAVSVTGNLDEAEWQVLLDLLNFKPGR